jgi:hypothetical protein
MPRPVAIPLPGFDELTVEEQIDDVHSLWDRIAATYGQIPVPEWHREVLDGGGSSRCGRKQAQCRPESSVPYRCRGIVQRHLVSNDRQ